MNASQIVADRATPGIHRGEDQGQSQEAEG